jgi:UDP-glucose 4-epimerase
MHPSNDLSSTVCVVTGGLGFIGSNLAIRLVVLGASVTIIDSMDPTCGANDYNIDPIRKDVEVIQGDCCDIELMRKVVRKTNYIFNLAGHVSHTDSMNDPFHDLRLNCTSPVTVLEACKYENRDAPIVYAGTRQTYGRPDELPLVETQRLKPIDINGVNKMAGEWYHMVYHQVYGMPTVSLRLGNTYGPRQLVKNAKQGFTGWFVKQAINGEEIQIFGNGQQLRGFTYVDDAVEAFLVAGSNEKTWGDYFNVGGQRPFTLEEFVQVLLKISGRGSYRLVSFPEEKKVIDIGSVYSSWAKLNFTAGWAPKISLEQGLQLTVEYYQRHRAHYW